MAVINLRTGQNIGHNDVPLLPIAAKAITTSDADEYSKPISVYVGTTGNVVVEPWDNKGEIVTFANAPAGSVLPVRVRKVFDTDTTASNLVAVY